MSAENVQERKGNPRYTVVLVPEGENKSPRTISFTRLGFLGTVFGTFFLIVGLIVAALIYTPLGARLSIARSDLEQRYGKQIVGIQNQLQSLVNEMTVLRAYNLRLRTALGEKVHDSIIVTSSNVDTVRNADSSEIADEGRLHPSDGISQASMASVPFTVPVENRAKQRLVEFPLSVPTDGFVSKEFNPQEFHYGMDFAGKTGSAVFASADGSVLFAEWTYDDGYMMLVSHEEGYMTAYKHNEALLKSAGMTVKRGEVIALLGNTGSTSSGPHLHFEVWKDGVPQDPSNYLLTTQ